MIQPTDKSFAPFLQEKIDNLNKPKGSLGRLESLAVQVGLVQHTLTPRLEHPCHVLFGADHGIEREGVSFSPREVTWQQMKNYGRGGGGVNMFCRQHGFRLRVVDVGVDYDFDPQEDSHIIDRKIARGTANFLYGPAMTAEQFHKAMDVGAEIVDECASEGCNIISFGEMGIGNTSPSSVIMSLLQDIPLERCVGAGSGLPGEGVKRKLRVLEQSVERFRQARRDYLLFLRSNSSPASPANPGFPQDSELFCTAKDSNPPMSLETIMKEYDIRYFCGFEMAAAVGGMLRAAERRMVVLVDGFIMSACMLAAASLDRNVLDYAVFGHCGDESGHKLMLDTLGVSPLLHLGLRLGEGTGAICAFPIVQSAVNMINEMDNFAHAEITKYF